MFNAYLDHVYSLPMWPSATHANTVRMSNISIQGIKNVLESVVWKCVPLHLGLNGLRPLHLIFRQLISTWDVLGVRWGWTNEMDCNWFHALTISVSSTDNLNYFELERNVKYVADIDRSFNFSVLISCKLYVWARLLGIIVECLIMVNMKSITKL